MCVCVCVIVCDCVCVFWSECIHDVGSSLFCTPSQLQLSYAATAVLTQAMCAGLGGTPAAVSARYIRLCKVHKLNVQS